MMKTAQDIIIAPVITEASMAAIAQKKYTFRVMKKVNKQEIAAAVDADGVHVGQSDMEAGEVRAKLGPDKIIGVTAKTVEQALLAQQRGADYLGVGAVFHTNSKSDAKEITHERLREICQAVRIPVVAIGGITQDNAAELSGSGIDGIAVISAIFAQKDIEKSARTLKKLAGQIVRSVQ